MQDRDEKEDFFDQASIIDGSEKRISSHINDAVSQSSKDFVIDAEGQTGKSGRGRSLLLGSDGNSFIS